VITVKNLKHHIGTPITHRKVTEADGHRTNEMPPARKPVPDSNALETGEQAQARRQREGGKD
jgi:hypothetical protein